MRTLTVVQFTSGTADMRSQVGHRVRKMGAVVVFGATIAETLLSDNKRTSSIDLKKMVGWDEEKNTYSSHVTLLYGEGSGTRLERAFRSETLMKVSCFTITNIDTHSYFRLNQALRVILFGPSSLNEGSITTMRDTLGKLWGVKEVSAGAMATTATVVCESVNTSPIPLFTCDLGSMGSFGR